MAVKHFTRDGITWQ